MPRRLLTGVLVVAAALAAAVATAAPGPADPAPAAAPPPSICRAAPAPSGWEAVPSDGPVSDYSGLQDYRGALGIGDGLHGDGVTIADVEYEWRASHVELAARGLPSPPRTGLPPGYQAADHGTAVLGVLGAAPDGQGVSGLAPGAVLRPVSPFAGGSYDPAKAVTDAAKDLRPGDVLLVELQAVRDEDGQLMPVEAITGVRNAIRAATAAGVVVVEPAGNGGADLAGLGIAGPGSADYSGALVVGAGGSGAQEGGSADLQRIPGSNYGTRVDVQGVGAAVVTSGYGEMIGGSADRSYTACFDGTSSASATVAGAVAALQGGAIALTGRPLAPGQIRALLRDTGLPQAGGDATPIGPRPQVDAALLRLAGAPPPAADGSVPPELPVTAAPSPPVLPAPPAVNGAPGALPSVRGLSAVFTRRSGRLVIRFTGLVKGSSVTVAGRRVTVAGGRATVLRRAPGRLVVRVAAPRRGAQRFTVVQAVVIVPARGPARVVRL